jgi:predicted O-methyltransferase YrrM
MGQRTLAGTAREGIFIPYRYADSLPLPGKLPPYPAVAARLAAAADDFRALLCAAAAFADDLARIGPDRPPAPRWDQDWFATLDALAAYTIVRTRRPARIVEVGAGHSTRFLARAIADGGRATRLTAIDPAPRAALGGLKVELVTATVGDADPTAFAGLAPGDVLFIDSSHILVPGSDVDLLLNRVLPDLPAGVLLHVHDIFLPDDYPADWHWRGYNEQQGVAPLITAGWRPLFASHYVTTRMADDLAASIAATLPRAADARAASLWLTTG